MTVENKNSLQGLVVRPDSWADYGKACCELAPTQPINLISVTPEVFEQSIEAVRKLTAGTKEQDMTPAGFNIWLETQSSAQKREQL